MAERGAGDIPLEPPTARHADVQPAAEDRTYAGFIVAALVIAVGAGFVLAVVVPLAASGVTGGASRLPWLIQAHGWAQLQGWAGLFVAGMAIRIIPRFAGRRPIPSQVTLPILVALVASVVVRIVVQPWIDGDAGAVLLVAAGALGAGGMAAVAAVLGVTLAYGRKRGEPWEVFAWAGAGWWAAWAGLTLLAAIRASQEGLLTPFALDAAATWLVMLGAVGNFIWAVQSRSVRVFFGRRLASRRRVVAPAVALNGGAALVLLSTAGWDSGVEARMEGLGLAAAGAATVVLAYVVGSLWGQAHRLRPRARAAAAYVVGANWSAVVAGALLVYAGTVTVADGAMAEFWVRDAARHAYGLGLITMLILGMARLIAPMFAMSRAEARGASLAERLPFWLLLAALVLRVAAALVATEVDEDTRQHVLATSGALAWAALVLFALSVVQAIRDEPRMKALLAETARRPG